MKLSSLAISLALICMWTTTPAAAQSRFSQPDSVQSTAFESYYAQADAPAAKQESPSPGDADVPPPVAAADAADCVKDYCGGDCRLCCDDPDPWRMFDCWNENNCRGLSITGWLAAAYTGNAHNPTDNFNGPITFVDRANEVTLNQLYLVMEKALEPDCCGWQVGGRVDVMYGTDHRFTQARGLETHQDFSPKWNSHRFYGVAMPQAYAEVGYNNLSMKLGHYYTIIGYEGVMAPGVFFVTHPYTHQYGEPFTHTGVLATYKYSDGFSLIGGVDRGWDNFEDDNDQMSFLGGISWTSCDGRTSLAVATSSGDEANARTGGIVDSNRWFYSVVLSHKINDRWTYVLQHDNGEQDAGAAGGGADAQWYGVNQYLFYTINCCWTAGLRFEWFRDDDGTRVAALDAGNTASAGGFEGSFYGISAGLNWKPNDNLTVRPEVRWDWYEGANGVGGIRPYDSGTDGKQFLFAIDGIYLF